MSDPKSMAVTKRSMGEQTRTASGSAKPRAQGRRRAREETKAAAEANPRAAERHARPKKPSSKASPEKAYGQVLVSPVSLGTSSTTAATVGPSVAQAVGAFWKGAQGLFGIPNASGDKSLESRGPEERIQASGPSQDEGSGDETLDDGNAAPQTSEQKERPIPQAIRDFVSTSSEGDLVRLAHYARISRKNLQSIVSKGGSQRKLDKLEQGLGRMNRGLPPKRESLDEILFALDSLKQSNSTKTNVPAVLGISKNKWDAILENPKELDESTEEHLLKNLLAAGATFPLRPDRLKDIAVKLNIKNIDIHKESGVSEYYVGDILNGTHQRSFNQRLEIQRALERIAKRKNASDEFLPKPFSFLPFMPLSMLPAPWIQPKVDHSPSIDSATLRDRAHKLGVTGTDLQEATGMHRDTIHSIFGGKTSLVPRTAYRISEALDTMASEVPDTDRFIELIKVERDRLGLTQQSLAKALEMDFSRLGKALSGKWRPGYEQRKKTHPQLIKLQNVSAPSAVERSLLNELRHAVTALRSSGKDVYGTLGFDKSTLNDYLAGIERLDDRTRVQLGKRLQLAGVKPLFTFKPVLRRMAQLGITPSDLSIKMQTSERHIDEILNKPTYPLHKNRFIIQRAVQQIAEQMPLMAIPVAN